MALTKVKAGHLVALDMAPLFVGKESGCFEKAGLDVETIFFANPGDNNAALAGGSIDFSTNPFTLPFFAANSGVPIRVISGAGGWGIIEVIAQKNTGLKSIADIKSYAASGKPKLKIATLQGDTLELILTRSFANAGIDKSSVELVYFNDLLAMVEAFRSGQVEILSHIKPYTTEMEVDKGAVLSRRTPRPGPSTRRTPS
jgi:ABC-type nitrate/sulfonate/bicarbonate transport system substrate-binding protein